MTWLPRMVKWVGAALLVLLVAAGIYVTVATPADAAPWDCKEGPMPQYPGRGVTGELDPVGKPPAHGDPWRKSDDTSIYEQYGYAGLKYETYDLGCGGGMRDPGAVIDTQAGNAMLGVAKFLVALANGLHNQVAQPGQWTSQLDGLAGDITDALDSAVWGPFLPLMLVIVAVGLVWSARAANFPRAIVTVGWALLVMAAATYLIQYPATAGSVADRTITTTVGNINTEISSAIDGQPGKGSGEDVAREQGRILVDSLLYQSWLRGTFGTDDSAAAKKYGPELYKASALTWAEAKTRNEDELNQLVEQKRKDWEEIATKVKEDDPDAYYHLTGHAGGRAGQGAMAMLAAFATAVFRIVADVLVLAALLIIRLLVMIFPAVAVIGVYDRFGGFVRSLGLAGLAAVINSIIFSAGAGLHAAVTSRLLSSDLSSWMILVLGAVITVAAWRLLSPFRSLTSMVTAGSYGQVDTSMPGKGAFGRAARWASWAYWSRMMAGPRRRKKDEVPGDDAPGDEQPPRDNGWRTVTPPGAASVPFRGSLPSSTPGDEGTAPNEATAALPSGTSSNDDEASRSADRTATSAAANSGTSTTEGTSPHRRRWWRRRAQNNLYDPDTPPGDPTVVPPTTKVDAPRADAHVDKNGRRIFVVYNADTGSDDQRGTS